MRIGPFVKRKEVWLPTWKGWLAFLVICVSIAATLVLTVGPFLAVNRPLGAPVLIMEGWVAESGIRNVIALHEKNPYKLVICTGIPIEQGLETTPYGTYANLGVARLKALGFKGTNLVAVPGPSAGRDRTYHSAVALKKYLLANTEYRSIDVLSDSVHARRSWILFRRACEPEIKVGVIAHFGSEFDMKVWWRTSQGVRTVISEAIAYVYAKFVSRPN